MNNKLLTLVIAFVLTGTFSKAQSGEEKKVADAVEHLRKAMVDGDKTELGKAVSDKLSYGHSGGHIDSKTEFVDKLTTGKSDFVTMDLTAQTISIIKKTAIVRHTLDAKTNDNNKPGDVHLLVMLVFQKLGGRWILIARQAVHPT